MPSSERPLRRLESCPACRRAHVHPVRWRHVPGDRWEMQLRCPDCDWSHTTVADRREVEHYERVIERGRDALVLEIERVRLEAMTEEVDRFVRALQRDDILPFDF